MIIGLGLLVFWPQRMFCVCSSNVSEEHSVRLMITSQNKKPILPVCCIFS